jgi:hypothetical protein
MELDTITIIHGIMFVVAFAILAISFLDGSL